MRFFLYMFLYYYYYYLIPPLFIFFYLNLNCWEIYMNLKRNTIDKK